MNKFINIKMCKYTIIFKSTYENIYIYGTPQKKSLPYLFHGQRRYHIYWNVSTYLNIYICLYIFSVIKITKDFLGFSRIFRFFSFLLVQESWNIVFSLDGHIMRSHHAWFFEDALTSDTAKKQTLRLLIFLYQRVFTKVLIEKGTGAF